MRYKSVDEIRIAGLQATTLEELKQAFQDLCECVEIMEDKYYEDI